MSEQLGEFSALTGIKLELGKTINFESVSLPRFAERMVDIYEAKIFGKRVVLVNFADDGVERVKVIVTRLEEQFSLPVVLTLPQVTQRSRMVLLENEIPFLTQSGETFLPFVGARLFAVKDVPLTGQRSFSPIAQRLFILLLIVQIGYEKKGILLFSDLEINKSLVTFKGGSRFIAEVGRKIGINSRTSFIRAVDELISAEIIRAFGITKERRYSFVSGSRVFFEKGRALLFSPLAKQVMYFDRRNWAQLGRQHRKSDQMFLAGTNALAKVTMISASEPNEFVIGREGFNEIAGSEVSRTDRTSAEYVLQKSSYDLAGFNELYQRVDEQYSEKCVDPINLYLMMVGDRDERVQGELEELLFGVLGEN